MDILKTNDTKHSKAWSKEDWDNSPCNISDFIDYLDKEIKKRGITWVV